MLTSLSYNYTNNYYVFSEEGIMIDRARYINRSHKYRSRKISSKQNSNNPVLNVKIGLYSIHQTAISVAIIIIILILTYIPIFNFASVKAGVKEKITVNLEIDKFYKSLTAYIDEIQTGLFKKDESN